MNVHLRCQLVLSTIVLMAPSVAALAAGRASEKLECRLNDALTYYASQKSQSAATCAANTESYGVANRLTIKQNKIFVEMFLADTGASYLRRLNALGVTRDQWYGRLNRRLQALVPMDKLNGLASEAKINWIQSPSRPHAIVTSEGVAKTYANTYQSHAPVYDGTGVKVAIIDLGFQGYAAKLGTELPATVVAQSFRSDADLTGGGAVHGTACAEVVHDMAPGAQLYLLNFGTDVELNNAVNFCINNGIKVISHSVGWTNSSFYDGTGDLKTIVDNATAAGIVWCNAAGNAANRHWDGTFSDPDGNTFENFSVLDETINMNLVAGGGCTLELTWDQWPVAASDYDLFLWYDNGGNPIQVAASTSTQSGTQPPEEGIYYMPPAGKGGTYYIKIKKRNGVATRLALFCYEYDLGEYNTIARSLMDPAPVANAFAVGAVNVNSDVIEGFSSQGPTESNAPKPDISAPDGNANSVYGTFYGTSSACPHTAGAAALLISANNTRSVATIKSLLKTNSLDLGNAGFDNAYGAGRLRMPDITPPSIGTVSSSTHSINTWTNVASVSLSWGASVDTWSGVAGYSYVWDNLPLTIPDNIVDGTTTSLTTTLGNSRTWYFHLVAVDNAGNASTAVHFGPLQIDTSQPLIPVLLSMKPLITAWSRLDTVKASWSDTDLLSGVQGYGALVDHNAHTVVSSGLIATPDSLARAVNDGTWYIHIAGRDSAGNWSPTLDIGPYRIDRTPPPAPTILSTVPAPRIWTNNRTVTGVWTSIDILSGTKQFHWSWDTLVAPGTLLDSGVVLTPYSSRSQRLSDGKSWWLHVVAVDSAGNQSARTDVGPFYIDSTAPKLPTVVSTTPLASVWTDSTIKVTYTGQSDAMSGVASVAFGWDTSALGAPTTITLPTGSSTSPVLGNGKHWYVHLRTIDSAGNVSATYHAGPFFVDHVAPGGSTIIYSSFPSGAWENRGNIDTVRWTISASDTIAQSNIAGYSWFWSRDSATLPDTLVDGVDTAATSTSPPSTDLIDGKWYFNLRSVDGAGNWEVGMQSYGPIMIDITVPTGTVQINGGASQTTDSAATVHIVGHDVTSGADSCVVTMTGTTSGHSLIANEALVDWSMRDHGGDFIPGWRYLSVRIHDRAGNWSTQISDSIYYAGSSAVNDHALTVNAFAVNVFPNPATPGDVLSIHAWDGVGSVRVTLIDAIGRTVMQRDLDHATSAFTIPFSKSLPAGEYVCRVERAGRVGLAAFTVLR